MDPFRETALMLARQVTGLDDLDRRAPHPGASDPRVAGAKMEINLRLESMVRGICQQVWVDSAAVASVVEARVREAVNESSIEAEIARAVQAELDFARRSIVDRVRKRIQDSIDRAIDERVGKAPATLAKKITDKMWDAFANVYKPPRLGGSNVYGRRGAPRSRSK
jgi:hypothetical protein